MQLRFSGMPSAHAEAYRAGAADANGQVPERAVSAAGGERILRGYSSDDRIVYGTGVVIGNGEIKSTAASLLARPEIAYLHMRSAANNCFTLRIERA